VYHAPPAQPPEAIQKDTAETVLRKLMELNDPKYAACSYILAVMLERKRLLKIQSQFRQDGKRIFVYEQPKTGDIFTIPDPDLQLDQLQQVQHDVANLLEHGLPSAPGQPGTTPVALTPADAEDLGLPVKSAGEAPPFVETVDGKPSAGEESVTSSSTEVPNNEQHSEETARPQTPG
jgi:hypothetical protein